MGACVGEPADVTSVATSSQELRTGNPASPPGPTAPQDRPQSFSGKEQAKPVPAQPDAPEAYRDQVVSESPVSFVSLKVTSGWAFLLPWELHSKTPALGDCPSQTTRPPRDGDKWVEDTQDHKTRHRGAQHAVGTESSCDGGDSSQESRGWVSSGPRRHDVPSTQALVQRGCGDSGMDRKQSRRMPVTTWPAAKRQFKDWNFRKDPASPMCLASSLGSELPGALLPSLQSP